MNLTSKKMLEELKSLKVNLNNPFLHTFLKLVVMSSIGVMASDGEIEEPEIEMYRSACKILDLEIVPIEELEEFVNQEDMRTFLKVGLLKSIGSLLEAGIELESLKVLLTIVTGYLAAVAQADNQLETEEIEFISPFLELYNTLA